MPEKYTYEFIKNKFKECEYELISKEYVNCKEKLQYICLQHKDKGIQQVTFDKLIQGKRCTYCSNCHKATEQEIKNICDSLNFEFINTYSKNSKRYVNYICKKHMDKGIQTKALNDLKINQGCKYCSGKGKTTDDFINEMNKINNNIIILGEYKKAITKIKCQCKIDNTIWYSNPNKLLSGRGCPECAKVRIADAHKKTEQEFLNELYEINPDIIILSPYTGIYNRIECKCKICGFVWKSTPSALLHKNVRCPKSTESYNENKLQKILSNYSINFSIQKRYLDCRDIKPLPFDLFLEDYNILIEYDGEGHYKPIRRGKISEEKAEKNLKITQYHDKIKTEYCKNNNIPLIRIPYWEQGNLECFLFEKLKELHIDIYK